MPPNNKTNIPIVLLGHFRDPNQVSPVAEDPLQYSVQVLQTMKQSPFQLKVAKNSIFLYKNYIEKGYKERSQVILERISSSRK